MNLMWQPMETVGSDAQPGYELHGSIAGSHNYGGICFTCVAVRIGDGGCWGHSKQEQNNHEKKTLKSNVPTYVLASTSMLDLLREKPNPLRLLLTLEAKIRWEYVSIILGDPPLKT